MSKGLSEKPEESLNSTKAPPKALAMCSNERPSSITMTLAPAPDIAEQTSCRNTDLPDPDLPNTATLWLPAAFWNGDQKNGCPRLPISSTCGICPPVCSP
jgi:hypothetical protein